MNFLADENVSLLVVERLRADGHDVVHVAELEPGAADDKVLEIARVQQRLLITEDTDFGELVIRRQFPASAVILLEFDKLSAVAEARHVGDSIALHADRMMGNLVIVEPSRLRVRPLPR